MRKKAQRGIISIEVILILVPFMLCFMTLLNISRMVEAEVIIHHAITQTAKEISAYSYVLTKTGISEKVIATNQKSKKFRTDVDKTLSDLTELSGALGNLGSGADLRGQIDTIGNNINSLKNTTSGYISNPKSIATGILSVLKQSGRSYLMRQMAASLARGSIDKQLRLMTNDPGGYLERIGVVDGLEGLDFSETHFMDATEGGGEITIVVTFSMKNNVFPMFDFGEHRMCLCAKTLLW